MRKQIATLTNPSYLTEMREQMAALVNGGRMQIELSAALGSYQELINGSALASFLVAPNDTGKLPTQVIEVKGFDNLEADGFTVLDADQMHNVDLEIVKALSEGEATALPAPAVQRLRAVYLQIVFIWDMLIRIFDTYAAIAVLVGLMSGTSEPADVPKQAALLPNYERQLLADYRIVNRNGARLRAGPSTSSQVLLSLQLGMPVEVQEKNEKGWFRVSLEYQGEWVEGWIYFTVTTPVPAPQRSNGLVVDAGTE
jgi:hypothetical protein